MSAVEGRELAAITAIIIQIIKICRCSVQYGQILFPLTDGCIALFSHRGGDLAEVGWVVGGPGGEELAEGYGAEFGVEAVEVGLIFAEAGVARLCSGNPRAYAGGSDFAAMVCFQDLIFEQYISLIRMSEEAYYRKLCIVRGAARNGSLGTRAFVRDAGFC